MAGTGRDGGSYGGKSGHLQRVCGILATLAVAALKGAEVLFLRFDAQGRLQSVERPTPLTRFGRLRSVTAARNGDLLLTTAEGTGDRVLRVSSR